jgi:hypothetical protein
MVALTVTAAPRMNVLNMTGSPLLKGYSDEKRRPDGGGFQQIA